VAVVPLPLPPAQPHAATAADRTLVAGELGGTEGHAGDSPQQPDVEEGASDGAAATAERHAALLQRVASLAADLVGPAPQGAGGRLSVLASSQQRVQQRAHSIALAAAADPPSPPLRAPSDMPPAPVSSVLLCEDASSDLLRLALPSPRGSERAARRATAHVPRPAGQAPLTGAPRCASALSERSNQPRGSVTAPREKPAAPASSYAKREAKRRMTVRRSSLAGAPASGIAGRRASAFIK